MQGRRGQVRCDRPAPPGVQLRQCNHDAIDRVGIQLAKSWCAEPAGVGGQGKMAFAFVTLITSLLSVVAASRGADVLTAS